MEEKDAGFEVVVHEGSGAQESTTIAGTFAGQHLADQLMQRLLAEGKVVSITHDGATVVPRRGSSDA